MTRCCVLAVSKQVAGQPCFFLLINTIEQKMFSDSRCSVFCSYSLHFFSKLEAQAMGAFFTGVWLHS